MKKIFTILGGICILALSTISYTFAYTQEQIEAYQWAYKYGLTTQPTIEQARMNSPLTRQAFAKMVVNYLENVVGIKKSALNSCNFPDEDRITNDLKPYAKRTCTYQIMGSDGKKFNPTQLVDRAQLGTVFSRILWGDKHDVGGKGYYIYHVNALQDAGIMNNIKNVQGVTAKRGDVLIMFKRMYEKFGSNIYLDNGGQSSTYSAITNNKENKPNLDAIDYNDLLIEISDECDTAIENFDIIFDDEPSVDTISKSLKNTISICKNAKDKAIKVGDYDGDSTLKDAIVATLDANINFLNLYETSKPYWDKDNISENDEDYRKLVTDLEKKSYIIDKSLEYLGEIQESFAEKHGFKLSNQSNDTNSSTDNSSISYRNNINIDETGDVIYTGKDGTIFYYNEDFLKVLKDTAEKKGESDLVKYLEVELKYSDSASEFEFDPDEFYEAIGVNFNNIDKDSLTKEEKEKIAENFGVWADGIAKKAREINDKYESDLKKVVNNVRNDKFGLNEKYNKTKDYLEFGNNFLSEYCKTMSNVLRIALTSEEDEDSTEEGIRIAVSMITLTLDFKNKTDEYNEFNKGWVEDTIELLGGELVY